MLSPVNKTSVADSVFDGMLEMLASRKWIEGTKIPSENELKEYFQVSRNTVRQAIQKLSALGVLEARQGEGTFVKKIDTGFYLNILIPSVFLAADDCIKILEFEKSIQVESVKIAGVAATTTEIEKLAFYLDQMKSKSDPDEFFEFDIEYHKYLSQITHNEMFYKSMMIIKGMLSEGLRQVVIRYGKEHSIYYHTRIYELLLARKVDEAALLMDEHMREVLDNLKTVLNK